MPDKKRPYQIEITSALIRKYLEGRLDGKTMHAIERQALNDQFLAEALEGFEQHDPNQSDNIRDLQARVQERLKRREVAGGRSSVIRYRNFQMAAAAIMLILIGVSIFFFAPETGIKNQKVAYSPHKQVVIPESLPSNTSPAPPEMKPGLADSNASSDIAVHRPKKPPVLKKYETSLSPERKEKKLDTTIVVGYATRKRQAITGSVKVVPAPALMAARTSGNDRKIPLSGRGGKDTILVKGKIKDSSTGAPLPGVTVRVAGTQRRTVSDAGGHFRLALSPQSDTLDFTYIGYKTKQIIRGEDGRQLNVTLQPDQSRLNEMVVVGYGEKAHKNSYSRNEARPLNGFAAFRRYVKDSLRYPPQARAHQVGGTVRLSFLVMPDSTIQQITVIKGLGYGTDQEARRLLREGPAWYPVKPGDTTLQELKIHFRMKEGHR